MSLPGSHAGFLALPSLPWGSGLQGNLHRESAHSALVRKQATTLLPQAGLGGRQHSAVPDVVTIFSPGFSHAVLCYPLLMKDVRLEWWKLAAVC